MTLFAIIIFFVRPPIGVDLAGILRGTHGERRRWVGAEWGGVWWGVSPLQPTRGSGERRELPQRGPGQSPAENGFWRILKATERSFLYLWWQKSEGTICTCVIPTPNSGGTCPRVLPRSMPMRPPAQSRMRESKNNDSFNESCVRRLDDEIAGAGYRLLTCMHVCTAECHNWDNW